MRKALSLAWSTSLVLPILVAAAAAGCNSTAPRGEHEDHQVTDVQSIRSCNPAGDANLSVKTRKDRIAKGVYRASRRIAVEEGLELWNTPYGQYWVVANNFNTFAHVLAEQAVEIYGDNVRGVHEGDVVLDGGAHFGGFTRTALNRGARLVVAIEIAPENAQCLRRNFASEIQAGRVIVYEKGVWDKDDTMVLSRKNNTWADHVDSSGPGPSVAVTTIDAIVSDLRLPKVDFIKLDIEGAERNALAGAPATLRTYRPRMAVASYHRPDDLAVLPPLALSEQPDYTTCVEGRSLGHGFVTLFFR
jgi:FkbM family methyltransferase